MTRRDLTDPSRAAQRVDAEAGLKAPAYENIAVPEEFGPVEVVVDDHKVKRFAFTQDDYGERYFRDGPDGPRIGHAALLANDLLQLFTLRYAASQVVGLHTEEELWFERPVPVGAAVRLTGRYVERYERRGQGCVVMTAEAADPAGGVYLRHRGVEIMRTRPREVAGRSSAAPPADRVDGEFDRGLAPVRLLGDGAAPGMGLAPITKEVTQEQMSVFSRIGEYVYNIHDDLRTARAAGLDVPLVQGQQQVCHLAELLTGAFGPSWFTTGWLRAKFLRPVYAWEAVSVEGAVRRVEQDGAELRIDAHAWIRRADGSLATVAWASGRVPADRKLVTTAAPG